MLTILILAVGLAAVLVGLSQERLQLTTVVVSIEVLAPALG
jgi:hypothetical protein